MDVHGGALDIVALEFFGGHFAGDCAFALVFDGDRGDCQRFAFLGPRTSRAKLGLLFTFLGHTLELPIFGEHHPHFSHGHACFDAFFHHRDAFFGHTAFFHAVDHKLHHFGGVEFVCAICASEACRGEEKERSESSQENFFPDSTVFYVKGKN